MSDERVAETSTFYFGGCDYERIADRFNRLAELLSYAASDMSDIADELGGLKPDMVIKRYGADKEEG